MKQLKSCYDINDTVNYCIASVPCKFQLRSELAGVELHHILGPDTRGLLALLTCSDGCGTGAGGHHHPDTRHLTRSRNPPGPEHNELELSWQHRGLLWLRTAEGVMTSSHDIMTRVTRGNWRRRVWHGPWWQYLHRLTFTRSQPLLLNIPDLLRVPVLLCYFEETIQSEVRVLKFWLKHSICLGIWQMVWS